VTSITIAARVIDEVIAHAREDAPLECCGLLVAGGGAIDEAVRTRNAKASRTAYLVDPEDHFAAIKRARQAGRRIAGAYHSHPRSPAVPSPADLREAHDPDLVYLIVSLADPLAPSVRAFAIRDGQYRERQIVSSPAR
jgi:proteasome lid subunit RPN8/RPN11